MRLVHETKDHTGIACVMCGKGLPQLCKVSISRTAGALADDFAVPASIVVDINDAVATGIQACFHEGIVFGEIGWVERSTDHIVGQILPCNGQSVDVEPNVLREMLHLPGTIAPPILGKWRINVIEDACALKQRSVDVQSAQGIRYHYGSVNTKVEPGSVISIQGHSSSPSIGEHTQQCSRRQTAPQQEPSPRSGQESSRRLCLKAY